MSSRIPPLAFRLALLVAIGLSAALLIDYMRPLPAFCELGSGCERVRRSAYSHLLGIPVPVFGLACFSALMTLSLIRRLWAERLVRPLAIAAGLGGVLFLLLQAFVLHVFCRLCIGVDCAAIIAALSTLAVHPSRPAPSLASSENIGPRARDRWLWPWATAMSVLLPVGWSLLQPLPPVPAAITRMWVPDKINVVEFADFQCPFCRQLHPPMAELLGEYEGRVNFVRLNMPLPQHGESRSAARAYCCAEDQGKATAMADALFQAPSLSPESCEKIAASLGLSMDAYRDCVKNPSTEARIDEQIRLVRAAGLAGLPTVWIGSEGFVGVQSSETLRSAFAQAARGKETLHLPPSLLWLAFAAGLLVVALLALRGGSPRSATLP